MCPADYFLRVSLLQLRGQKYINPEIFTKYLKLNWLKFRSPPYNGELNFNVLIINYLQKISYAGCLAKGPVPGGRGRPWPREREGPAAKRWEG